MTIDRPLFDIDQPTGDGAALSPDRRRTLRQKADLAAGIHPATGAPLLTSILPPTLPGGDLTCGDCRRFQTLRWHGRTHFKCELHITHGAATDIRKSWPACTRYLTPPAEEATP